MKRTVSRLGLLLLVAALLAGCSGWFYSNSDLQATGVAAQAEILEHWETGMKVNDEPVIGVKVRVMPAGRPPYEATIQRILISKLDIPQFQPGAVIPVRYDPKDPSRVAIDLSPGRSAQRDSTGNPYHDFFTATAPQGAALLPPPPALEIYRGTFDDTADVRALSENNYVALGFSQVEHGGADLRQAIDQGKQIGASVIVLYGEPFDLPPGETLRDLPFHPGFAAGEGGTIGTAPDPEEKEGRIAAFWAKARPSIFGVQGRPLNDEEKTRLRRNNGLFVGAVVNGSPAATAGIQEGDVILAIDGKTILDVTAVPAFLRSIAGKKVRVELVRLGSPMSVTVQLNSSEL